MQANANLARSPGGGPGPKRILGLQSARSARRPGPLARYTQAACRTALHAPGDRYRIRDPAHLQLNRESSANPPWPIRLRPWPRPGRPMRSPIPRAFRTAASADDVQSASRMPTTSPRSSIGNPQLTWWFELTAPVFGGGMTWSDARAISASTSISREELRLDPGSEDTLRLSGTARSRSMPCPYLMAASPENPSPSALAGPAIILRCFGIENCRSGVSHRGGWGPWRSATGLWPSLLAQRPRRRCVLQLLPSCRPIYTCFTITELPTNGRPFFFFMLIAESWFSNVRRAGATPQARLLDRRGCDHGIALCRSAQARRAPRRSYERVFGGRPPTRPSL